MVQQFGFEPATFRSSVLHPKPLLYEELPFTKEADEIVCVLPDFNSSVPI